MERYGWVYINMDDHIYSTMAIQHHSILLEKDTPHKKLKALREWFTQDPYTHIWDLYQKWYHYLIKTPCLQNIQKLWMAGLASFGMLADTEKTLVTANTPWMAVLSTWLTFCTAEEAGTSAVEVDEVAWVVVGFCQGGSWAAFHTLLNMASCRGFLLFSTTWAWIPASGCQFRGHFKSTI